MDPEWFLDDGIDNTIRLFMKGGAEFIHNSPSESARLIEQEGKLDDRISLTLRHLRWMILEYSDNI